MQVIAPTGAGAAEHVLDLETVGWLIQTTDNADTKAACEAWLIGYGTAHLLGFGEAVALRQAALRWELARTAPVLVYP